MSMIHRIDHSNDFPTVIEFFGLPGTGKTAVANHLSRVLRKQGYNVRTSDDFVQWLSQQKKIKKLGFVGSRLGNALLQWFWSMVFALGLRPFCAIPISKVLRVPYINICFDRYLKTLDDHIVIMDQANVQLIWSIGAFSVRYNKKLLQRACRAVVQKKRYYVCLILDTASNFERIKKRKVQHSRFDHLSDVQLNFALSKASNIILDLREFIPIEDVNLIDIDAKNSREDNANYIYSVIINKYDVSFFDDGC